MNNSAYFKLLIALLLIKFAAFLFLIMSGYIGLGPDEAQYWTWSRQLDWGYYSKPPGIAWQIWLGTQIFGNTELGVRFFSAVLSFLISIAVYYLALAAATRVQTAFWAAMTMAFTPVGLISSFLAITDVGMVLSWTLASWIMVDALTKKEAPNYFLLGMTILFGALYKWPIYLFWLVVISWGWFYRFLLNSRLIAGVVISLLGLLPSLIWNIKHNWATFRHVGSTISGGNKSGIAAFGNPLDFLASQAGLFSPILFILYLFAVVHMFRHLNKLRPAILFCGITSFILFAAFFMLSFFQKIQGNWVDFAYPTAIVFLSWYLCESTKAGLTWLKIGILFSIFLTLCLLAVPYIQEHSIMINREIPYKANPFKHNLGWENLGIALDKLGYDSDKHFLFSDKYQTSSILSFYGPHQKRAYFLNLHGIRNNQFSFWPGMDEEQIGNTGFFVFVENVPHLKQGMKQETEFYLNELQKYFEHVELLGLYPIYKSDGKMVKGALIFKGSGYNGKLPVSVDQY